MHDNSGFGQRVEQFLSEQERAHFTPEQAALVDTLLTRCLHKAVETALVNIPHVLAGTLKIQANLEREKTKFLDANGDLKPHKNRLMELTQEVEINEPGLGPAEVLNKSANLLREELSATNMATEFTPSTQARPASLLLSEPLKDGTSWLKDSDE